MIKPATDQFAEERRQMVERQLIPRGIKAPEVLLAFGKVPREHFVPVNSKSMAYEDRPLPTMLGQTISQPYMVALMTELLGLPAQDECRVLEVGAGSGYQAAILAEMGHQVLAVERLSGLADFARKNLSAAGYGQQVKIQVGDGCLGWADSAPYDGVIVSAAAPKVPNALLDQLTPGAKLVIPCGDLFIQQLLQVSKTPNGEVEINKTIGCRFVPLIGKDGFKGE